MKFAVRTIKNQFHPLKVADDANIKQGEYVIVKTDKGEEVFRVEIVNKCIQHLWEKKVGTQTSVTEIVGCHLINISTFFHCKIILLFEMAMNQAIRLPSCS